MSRCCFLHVFPLLLYRGVDNELFIYTHTAVVVGVYTQRRAFERQEERAVARIHFPFRRPTTAKMIVWARAGRKHEHNGTAKEARHGSRVYSSERRRRKEDVVVADAAALMRPFPCRFLLGGTNLVAADDVDVVVLLVLLLPFCVCVFFLAGQNTRNTPKFYPYSHCNCTRSFYSPSRYKIFLLTQVPVSCYCCCFLYSLLCDSASALALCQIGHLPSSLLSSPCLPFSFHPHATWMRCGDLVSCCVSLFTLLRPRCCSSSFLFFFYTHDHFSDSFNLFGLFDCHPTKRSLRDLRLHNMSSKTKNRYTLHLFHSNQQCVTLRTLRGR